MEIKFFGIRYKLVTSMIIDTIATGTKRFAVIRSESEDMQDNVISMKFTR